MLRQERIGILGVPQDLGASRRGVDMGPSAIRVAGLGDVLRDRLGYEVYDYGNVKCHDFGKTIYKKSSNDSKNLHYLPHILETTKKMKRYIDKMISDECFPLIIGGDHSISLGTLGGLKRLHRGDTGILWIDAHADFNTPETSPSGNIHGMSFAIVNGYGNSELLDAAEAPCVSKKNSVLFGARSVDQHEINNINRANITTYTMSDIDERGFAVVAKEAIRIATAGVEHLHISLDIDALDPMDAPGTGTSVEGGITYREAHLLLELIHKTGKLSSLEVVEINPSLDVRNKTAKRAVELIASALGKTIL